MDNAIMRTTTDTMLEKLLTVDQAKELLAPTEGLAEHEFATDGTTNRVHFTFPEDWNKELDKAEDFDVTTASVDIDGTELALTKIGALDLASTVSFSKAAAGDTPGEILEDYLNYHYSHGARGKKNLKVLASNAGVLATTRGTLTPFSSASLLDSIIEGIGQKYDTSDLRIDYKWANDLQLTNLRVIIPSATREINSARTVATGDDPWSLGIELTNSLNGKSALELKGYLFAWWCTNGATIERASSGRYRRKPTLSANDAYEWSQRVVDDVFRDLDREFEAIQQLTEVNLDIDDLGNTVGRLFERFGIPDSARQFVTQNLVDSNDFTAYGLMNAVTAAANREDLSANAVNTLLSAGGDIAHVLSDQCEVCHRF